MSDAAKTAIDTLVEIAADENQGTGERIAASCAILDRLDKIPEEATATA